VRFFDAKIDCRTAVDSATRSSECRTIATYISKTKFIEKKKRKIIILTILFLKKKTLGGLIGKGESSRVFRVEPGGFALKIIERISNDVRGGGASSSTTPTDGRLEAELLSRMQHERVIKMTGWFDDGKRVCMALQYYPHGSLAKALRRCGALTDRAARGALRQVGEALEFVHSRGVIHRDVKAANVLCDAPTGRCVLADFGVAALAADSPVGTPYWMAPEVIASQAPVLVSDVWSLGCMTVELLVGAPPYFDLGPMAAMYRMVQDDAPPLPDTASPGALAFLRRCFVRDVALRPGVATLLFDSWLLDDERAPIEPISLDEAAFVATSSALVDVALRARGKSTDASTSAAAVAVQSADAASDSEDVLSSTTSSISESLSPRKPPAPSRKTATAAAAVVVEPTSVGPAPPSESEQQLTKLLQQFSNIDADVVRDTWSATNCSVSRSTKRLKRLQKIKTLQMVFGEHSESVIRKALVANNDDMDATMLQLKSPAKPKRKKKKKPQKSSESESVSLKK
jgi:serine/threonine protein kinase